jgi:hypothetical protein
VSIIVAELPLYWRKSMAKQEQQMATSDFNLEKLNTRELSEHVRATIQVGGNIAIFGQRGIGKTAIAKQQIKDAGLHEVYLNLSVMERTDLGGYPNILAAQQQKKFVDFLLPHFYQSMVEGKQGVVCLLDELDKSDPSLWAPLLELTQFRSINGFPLPNLVATIMTGNLISEGGSRPSLPLLDRAERFLIEADVTSWLTWAGNTGRIHPSITAFVTDNPKDLFGAVDPEDRYADPSPRGWTRASDILFRGEEKKWSHDMLHKKVCGCVGKDAGLRYANYYDYYQELLPMIDNIFKGKDISQEYKALEPSKQLIACMIACARLATHLDATNGTSPPVALQYVGQFLQHVPYESLVVSVRSQLTLARFIRYQLEDNPHWQEILGKVNQAAGS